MIREQIRENIGIIYLDRPKAINALSLDMIIRIKEILLKWENDDNIKAVLLDGCGQKGFCAGGDIKEIYNDYINNDNEPNKVKFFEIEFDLDKYISTYKKPIISHWFGITMGGANGLSMNSDFIIADESVNWAMPETILGFTPDVGVGKFISTLPQALGQYVGLLGVSLKADDLIKYGFADNYIDSSDYEELIINLFELSKDYEGQRLIDEFRKISIGYKKERKETDIDKNMEKINKYFSYPSLKEICQNLAYNLDDDFAQKCYEGLKERDSLVLALQFEKYFVAKTLTYEQTLELDLRLLGNPYIQNSTREGIKAKVIDKNHKAKWDHKSLDDVDMEMVNRLLAIDFKVK